jgi:mRNA-degrading endonuclease RelE of RelBE toxin-antitoxin system
VHIHRQVNDVVFALPSELATAIRDTIGTLAHNPYSAKQRLVGRFDDVFEVVVKSHRIVYQVQEAQRRVKVARVHLVSEVE